MPSIRLDKNEISSEIFIGNLNKYNPDCMGDKWV